MSFTSPLLILYCLDNKVIGLLLLRECLQFSDCRLGAPPSIFFNNNNKKRKQDRNLDNTKNDIEWICCRILEACRWNHGDVNMHIHIVDKF
jgi:hypothetical protein